MRSFRGICLVCALLPAACLPAAAPSQGNEDVAAADAGGDSDAFPADPGPPDSGHADIDGIMPPGTRVDCKSCTSDLDCGADAHCLTMGKARVCLQSCRTHRDCPPSYFCYEGRSEGGWVCEPVTFACVACAHDAPCADGRTCDLVTGECKEGRLPCCPCTWDFDCGSGERCFKQAGGATGACVEACSDDHPCGDAANFACAADANGVPVCQPAGAPNCAGCPPDRPFLGPGCGDCWACREDRDCTQGPRTSCSPDTHDCVASPPRCYFDGQCGPDEHCDPDTWTCGGFCAAGRRQCPDGLCQDCCGDEDCWVQDEFCQDGRCEPRVDPCNGQCAGTSFPVCKVINHVPQCVQCDSDADCQTYADRPPCTCTGDPTFTCLQADGNVCQAVWSACATDSDCAWIDLSCTCEGGPANRCAWPDGKPCEPGGCEGFCYQDSDCGPVPDGHTLRCIDPPVGGGMGRCLDPSGTCDGAMTCCGPGRDCVDIPQILAPLSAAAMHESPICACDALRTCLGDVPCTPVADLCLLPHLGPLLCPDGVPDTRLKGGLCVDGPALDGRLFPPR